jgi:hypothetical protein
MATPKYAVRFTAKDTGRSHLEIYMTARRAKEVVLLASTRHSAANTHAEYLGRQDR